MHVEFLSAREYSKQFTQVKLLSVIYRDSCPACHGPIDSHRLSLGLPCRECLPRVPETLLSLEKDLLEKRRILTEILRNPGDYGVMRYVDEEIREFEKFFARAIGGELWPIQRSWIRRLLDGESFALVAPTGVGKSTLLQIYSLYMYEYGKRIYFITPTRELGRQTLDRLRVYADRLGLEINALLYDSTSRVSLSQIIDSVAERGILVTTSAILSRRFKDLDRVNFDIVVADDLDAVLKSSKNAERILMLLGYDESIIESAYRLNRLREDLLIYKVSDRRDLYEKIREEIEILRASILRYKAANRVGQLIVSTATGRSGSKTKILREVLDFDVGGVLDYVREIIDTYREMRDYKDISDMLQTLGPGTMIYVSKIFNRRAEDLYQDLLGEGFKIGIALSKRNDLKKFLNKEIDYIIATASFYGIAVRGIDAPLVVKNAVFIELPAHKISLESFIRDPKKLGLVLSALSKSFSEAEKAYEDLLRLVRSLRLSELTLIRRILSGEVDSEHYHNRKIVETLRDYIGLVQELMNRVGEEKILTRVGVISVRDRVVFVPDIMTYIQASGRTSRILNGRFTLGLSVILFRDRDLLDLFLKRMKRVYSEFEIRSFEEIDLDGVKRLQNRTRSVSSSSVNNDLRGMGVSIDLKRVLMIVESPTKARTISKLFGSNSKRIYDNIVVREFTLKTRDKVYVVEVIPSLGHITDLVVDSGLYGVEYNESFTPVYSFIRRCLSCGYQFTERVDRCPRCGSSKIRSQETTIATMRKLAQSADLIFIATDPDMEGEKIAYDIYNLLKPYNPNIYRVEFHEISRKAVVKAFENPRSINFDLVNAQIVRRVDDRWIGFIISRELQERYKMKWLGAGRVQTPVLKWIVDRYSEYKNSLGFWVYIYTDRSYPIEPLKIFVKSREELEKISRERLVKIKKVEVERKILSPPPPFSTDEMISAADLFLRFSPEKTMRIAQELFELGLITYHRTDSTHVSTNGVELAREYISRVYGERYFKPRSWGEEKAHEAIRPVYSMNINEIKESSLSGEIFALNMRQDHEKLYDLIFRRFIASQMIEAEVDYCRVTFDIGGYETGVEGLCRVYQEGFLKAYNTYNTIPHELLESEEILEIREMRYRRGSRVKLFTGGEIVRLMRERRIGRPSTYSKAIENNIKHGYVIESRVKRYLIPTKLGIEISSTIESVYPDILTERASRELEELVDRVANRIIDRDKALGMILESLSTHGFKEAQKVIEYLTLTSSS